VEKRNGRGCPDIGTDFVRSLTGDGRPGSDTLAAPLSWWMMVLKV
jgi:hypothetical protein